MDVELLKQAVKWARHEYETSGSDGAWQQAFWFTKVIPGVRFGSYQYEDQVLSGTPCQTGMCIAGHIVSQAGYEPRWDNSDPGVGRTYSVEGDRRSVGQIAADLLGVTQVEADDLFAAGNTIEMVESAARRLVELKGGEW